MSLFELSATKPESKAECKIDTYKVYEGESCQTQLTRPDKVFFDDNEDLVLITDGFIN